ncbi:MAG: type II toxin-antitoxin system PemK/MazF family toxin [Candidatus Altiarchaeota archaeon]
MSGITLEPGDVILAKVQYTDTLEIKTRPVVVLFEEYGNVVVAGVTSNRLMDGIPLSIAEGAVKDSVIKLNYLFTTSKSLVSKVLFKLTPEKKQIIHQELMRRLENLKK